MDGAEDLLIAVSAIVGNVVALEDRLERNHSAKTHSLKAV